MNPYKYSGKIKCNDCGQNFRGRLQSKHKVYFCTGYNNKKSNCKRFAIRESEISEIIEKHLDIYEVERGDRDLSDFVKMINVHNSEQGYVIDYIDGSESIVFPERIKF